MAKILCYTIGSEEKSVARLGWPYKTHISGSFNEFMADNPDTVVVRFGNSTQLYSPSVFEFDREFPFVLNKSEAIWLNCEKHKALKVMSKVVKTPKLYEKSVPRGKLVIVRPVAHTGGEGFRVAKGPLKLNNDEYAVEAIDTKTEYRVWFCGDKTMVGIRYSRKVHNEKFPNRAQWNYEICKTPRGLDKLALSAAKAVGIEVGASDVLKFNNKYYFLENNSSPTLDLKEVINFYKTNIPKLIKKKFNLTFDDITAKRSIFKPVQFSSIFNTPVGT